MTRIKEYCIATTILVVTRNLPREEKRRLFKLAGEIFAEEHDELGELEQSPYEILAATQSDASKVLILSNMKFDEGSKEFFERLYLEARSHEGIFQYYKGLVASLCAFVPGSVDSQPEQEISGVSHPAVQILNE